jgi:hypothetical protein
MASSSGKPSITDVAILSTTTRSKGGNSVNNEEANKLGMGRENRCGDTRPFTACQCQIELEVCI